MYLYESSGAGGVTCTSMRAAELLEPRVPLREQRSWRSHVYLYESSGGEGATCISEQRVTRLEMEFHRLPGFTFKIKFSAELGSSVRNQKVFSTYQKGKSVLEKKHCKEPRTIRCRHFRETIYSMTID